MPGYTLSAGRAVRHWRDEAAAAVTLHQVWGSPATTFSSRRCARRNKSKFARKRAASKFPTEMIVSHPSGVSLVRSENARAPVPGRGEIVRSFSEALAAFQRRRHA